MLLPINFLLAELLLYKLGLEYSLCWVYYVLVSGTACVRLEVLGLSAPYPNVSIKFVCLVVWLV